MIEKARISNFQRYEIAYAKRVLAKHQEYRADDLSVVGKELLEALTALLYVSTSPLYMPVTKREAEKQAKKAIAKATKGTSDA